MKGFTLIELLVVVFVILSLGGTAYFVLNPIELTKKDRDGTRMLDFADLKQAIEIVSESSESAKLVYCNGASSCFGSSNKDDQSSNGTGWLKVNVGSQKSVLMPTLPVDPLNDSNYHYTFCAKDDAWELAAALESSTYSEKMKDDQGNDPDLYEVGTNLALIGSGGSCTY